jgi:hypothetical protein
METQAKRDHLLEEIYEYYYEWNATSPIVVQVIAMKITNRIGGLLSKRNATILPELMII